MGNTYTQMHVQMVFAVQGRANLIRKEYKEELHKYITGIVQKREHKMLAINSMPDHIHIFVGLRPAQSVSDLVRDIKTNSSTFITENKLVKGIFNWQDGYGAFTYSRSHVKNVIQYVLNQETHHKKQTFKEEYLSFLQKFEIEYDERYLFDWIDLSNEAE